MRGGVAVISGARQKGRPSAVANGIGRVPSGLNGSLQRPLKYTAFTSSSTSSGSNRSMMLSILSWVLSLTHPLMTSVAAGSRKSSSDTSAS